jgi:hypothetical protein
MKPVSWSPPSTGIRRAVWAATPARAIFTHVPLEAALDANTVIGASDGCHGDAHPFSIPDQRADASTAVGVLFPYALPVVFAMSVGQALGMLAFVSYLLAIVAEVLQHDAARRRRRAPGSEG